MTIDLSNQNVLITGSSRGIGRAIAIKFAEAKATVIVHCNQNRKAAEQTIKSLKQGNHFIVQSDMTDPMALKNMVAEVITKLGRIHILVNNAGIFEEVPLTEQSYEQWQDKWQRTINTNLIGAANLSFLVAKNMIDQGGGRMINISSRGAFRGEPLAPCYGASKAGLNAMSQSLAQALAPYNILVFVIAPGFVETEMARPALQGERGKEIRNQSPLNRVAYPSEIANTAVFLASEGIDFLTGSIIDVNGASYLRS